MRFARQSTSRLAAFIALGLTLVAPAALTPAARAAELRVPESSEPSVPQGVLAIYAGDRPLTWDAATTTLARADVVFLGEQHDDPATHRLELALFQALHAAVGPRLVLSLEMFERDVQPLLDAYLAGGIPEADFLAKSRPWPNYATDYRPLVEYAKANGLRVIAANVPRPIASKVARQGLAALKSLDAPTRAQAASTVDCPPGPLFERFKETMQGHPGITDADVARMYLAQCLKDATMAESIAQALLGFEPSPLVFHVNGAFHSDEGLGVPEQLRLRMPQGRQVVTTVLPVATAEGPPAKGLADVVFMVPREKKE